jgi:hypothetical protein
LDHNNIVTYAIEIKWAYGSDLIFLFGYRALLYKAGEDLPWEDMLHVTSLVADPLHSFENSVKIVLASSVRFTFFDKSNKLEAKTSQIRALLSSCVQQLLDSLWE